MTLAPEKTELLLVLIFISADFLNFLSLELNVKMNRNGLIKFGYFKFWKVVCFCYLFSGIET